MRTLAIFHLTREIGLWFLRLKPKKDFLPIENVDILFSTEKVINQLESNGFSDLVSISKERLNAIIKFANSIQFQNLEGNNKFYIDYSRPLKPSSSLWYTNGEVMQCKAIKSLVYDKKILKIATSYLKKEPIIKDVRMWWSFPPEKDQYNSLYGYHYDIDALKFLKLFIYLTDVDENSGPHVIISKTHKRKTLFEKLNRRLTDEEATKRFKKDSINVMTANAGEGFFEDTFAYHKGATPKKPRFILQIEYAI